MKTKIISLILINILIINLAMSTLVSAADAYVSAAITIESDGYGNKTDRILSMASTEQYLFAGMKFSDVNTGCILVYDNSDVSAPQIIGKISGPGDNAPLAMRIRDNWLFVCYSGYFCIYDITDIGNIIMKGSPYNYTSSSRVTSTGGATAVIQCDDDYIYFCVTTTGYATSNGGFGIISANNQELSALSAGDSLNIQYSCNDDNYTVDWLPAKKMVLDGNYLYLSGGYNQYISGTAVKPAVGKITVLDITDRKTPIAKGSYQFSFTANGYDCFPNITDISIVKNSDYLYFSMGDNMQNSAFGSNNGVWVMDVSAAKNSEALVQLNPIRLGFTTGSSDKRCSGLFTDGKYLYFHEISAKATYIYAIPQSGNKLDPDSYSVVQRNISDGIQVRYLLYNGKYLYSNEEYNSSTATTPQRNGYTAISLRFLNPEYSVTDYALSKNELTAGNITMNATLTNHSMLSKSAVAIIAKYDDYMLSELNVTGVDFAPDSVIGVSAGVTLQGNGNESVTSMIWDSIENMELISGEYSSSGQALSAGKSLNMNNRNTLNQYNEGINAALMSDGTITVDAILNASGAVSVMAINTSINAETDRFKGIRYIDSFLTNSDKSFSFSFRPYDGGDYRILIKTDGINKIYTTNVSVPKPTISAVRSIDVAGSIADLILNINRAEKIGELKFDIFLPDVINNFENDYEFYKKAIGAIDISGKNASVTITYSEPPENVHCILAVGLKISKDAPVGVYPIEIKNISTKDKYGYPLAINLENAEIEIALTSQKQQLFDSAQQALLGLPNVGEFTNDSYNEKVIEYEKVKELFQSALRLGIRESRFEASSLNNYYAVSKEISRIEHELEIISVLKNGDYTEFDSIIEENLSAFNLDIEILNFYKNMQDKNKIYKQTKALNSNKLSVFSETFKNTVALEALRQTVWPELESVIKVLNSILLFNTDGTYSQKLNQTQRSMVMQSIARTEYSNLENARDAFDKAVISVYSQRDGSKGSGGGRNTAGTAGVMIPLQSSDQYAPEYEKPIDIASDKNYFNDLSDVEWARKSIDFLASKGIVNGVGGGKFSPNQEIKREEFVKVIAEAFELNSENQAEYSDVDKTAWYAQYIERAGNVVNGIGYNKFGVGESLTREDMCVLIYRIILHKNITIDSTYENETFEDEKEISLYAREAVINMYKAGIVNGLGENMFMPKIPATRAMVSKIIYDLLTILGYES